MKADERAGVRGVYSLVKFVDVFFEILVRWRMGGS